MAIDADFYQRYLRAEERAKELGLPLVEVLDRNGLLTTKARVHNIEVRVAEDLSRRVDRQNPNKLMSFYVNKPDGSGYEMFEAVKLWFETVVRNLANGTLEDL